MMDMMDVDMMDMDMVDMEIMDMDMVDRRNVTQRNLSHTWIRWTTGHGHSGPRKRSIAMVHYWVRHAKCTWSSCDHNFGTFDDFGVKNDQKVSHNMILMSKYKGKHGGKKGQKIRAGGSPTPNCDKVVV